MRRPRAAFTLFETLAVLALFALIAGIVASNHDALLPALRAESPEAALRGAFREAMREAAASGRRTALRFDATESKLMVYSDSGDIIKQSPCGSPGKTRLRFLDPSVERHDAADPGSPRVEFSPDGHHRPVLVELTTGDTVRRFRAEPFSGFLTPEPARP